MSRQSEAKSAQGWRKNYPCCANCESFTSSTEEVKTKWGGYLKEKNKRCNLGNFATGKSNWCSEWKQKKGGYL